MFFSVVSANNFRFYFDDSSTKYGQMGFHLLYVNMLLNFSAILK